MKIALITDQHLDGRKGSLAFWNYFQKFYDDVFFQRLRKKISKSSLIWATHLIIESLWTLILFTVCVKIISRD